MTLTIDKNNIIAVNRGDTFNSILFINKGTALQPLRYKLQEGDEVYLGVMQPDQYFENAILKKKFDINDLNPYGDLIINFEDTDTTCLLPGKYYYQIKGKLIQKLKIYYQDVTITQESRLKAGSLITNGSIINGQVINTGDSDCIKIEQDIVLSLNDVIKAFSKVYMDSMINGKLIEPKYEVNTLVPKTEIFIME